MNPEATWGLYPWFAEMGDDFVHPNDRHRFDAVHPYGQVFKRVGDDGRYIHLQYEGGIVRVRPDLFKPVAAPAFEYGVEVKTRPSRTIRRGRVLEIGWHGRRNEPFFILEIEGRRHKSWYFADELVPAG